MKHTDNAKGKEDYDWKRDDEGFGYRLKQVDLIIGKLYF